MRLLFGNILIKPLEAETTTSTGIYLPNTQHDIIQKGKIVAIGSGSLALDGSPIPIEVQPEDTVCYETIRAKDIMIEGVAHKVVEQRDIIMVI